MALIKCPECQKEVSDSALYCPACGKQLQKLKRSFLGRIIKWVFILFNIFMIYMLLVGLGGTSEIINNATSDAEKAGAVIGTGLGLITIGSLWVIGDIIIGILVFLTKPKG
ncbi:zinc ribbon domain-containing protein [Escherichia coli]|nr:zinc ribbon domain-containing protein [Escherichia coli]EJF7655179.1 zinc ribbon domain-containing protein [Escherichia coli]